MFVCIPSGKAIPEVTYTLSGGMLNPTHSLSAADAYGIRPIAILFQRL